MSPNRSVKERLNLAWFNIKGMFACATSKFLDFRNKFREKTELAEKHSMSRALYEFTGQLRKTSLKVFLFPYPPCTECANKDSDEFPFYISHELCMTNV